MPRVVVPILAFLLVFATPLGARAAAAGAPARGQSYDEVTEAVLVNVDGFWARAFAAGGLDYVSPTVVAVDGPLDTACGVADSSNVAASYCGGDQTIYYAPAFFLEAEQRIGNFAWHTVIAHEWGHHVQNLLGVPRPPGNAFELQADCLAGAYAQDARALGLLESGDITEATGMSAAGGDPIWLSQDELGAHGTNDDRITHFMLGYIDGVVGCALPFASTTLEGSVGGTTPIAVGLFGLLPTGDDVPAGLVAIEEGGRSLEEIAATFPNPVGAAELLAAWGFRENAYRNFVPEAVVGSVQVSLHRFGSAAAAAEALPYYAAGRAAVLGLRELRTGPLGDQSQAVTGEVAEGTEVTLYVRRTDLLVRVSAVVPEGDPVVIGRDVAKVVLAKPLVEPPASVPGSPLGGLLPTADEVPFGLLPTEEGARSEAEITASFPDPADAARRFVTWGWRENAYRYFAAPAGGGTAAGTVSLEVSLHRFATAAGAAEALPYYADGRAVAVGLGEIPIAPIGDGARAVGGTVAAGQEATVYARRGDLLIRVSAVAPVGDPTADSVAVAELVLANVG